MIDKKLLIAIIKGLFTFVPGFHFFWDKKRKNLRNSNSLAEFCYSFWLRILVHLKENEVKLLPTDIGEIGTAGSMGIGICALLSGSKKYYALDIEKNHDQENNIRLFDEILILFRNKTPIPEKFENLNLRVRDYSFPEKCIKPLFLDDDYVVHLKKDLLFCLTQGKSEHFNIVQQWQISDKLNLDFIFSRAVMEHVSQPDEVYNSIFYHLKNKGIMLHDIELHSHSLSSDIFGHYKMNKFVWSLIFGRRKFLLNRWKLENHLEYIDQSFNPIKVSKNFQISEQKETFSGVNEPYGASILAIKK